jgi:hypothetical protein
MGRRDDLRQSILEALSRTLDWAHVLRPLVAPFGAFMASLPDDMTSLLRPLPHQ